MNRDDTVFDSLEQVSYYTRIVFALGIKGAKVTVSLNDEGNYAVVTEWEHGGTFSLAKVQEVIDSVNR